MHIAKRKVGKSKGVLIITHKELEYLQVRLNWRKRNIPKYFVFPVFFLKRAILNRVMNSLSQKYVVGVHWGWSSEVDSTPDWVSFHMAANGTAKFWDGKFRIPLNSANFTPEAMKPKGFTKVWDIISISKSAKGKNIDKLFRSIREIFDQGRVLKIVLLVASNRAERANRHYTRIMQDYQTLFSDEEREHFVLIKTDPETGFKGLSTSFLSDLFNLTKVFTLFSQIEGESRVIKEAQMCGLPVVVKSDLLGGGRDYLNDKNGAFFDTYEDASRVLLDTVDRYKEFEVKPDGFHKELSESSSTLVFVSQLKEIFASLSIPFEGEMVNMNCLSRRLPSHYVGDGVYWAKDEGFRFKTTDIVNTKLLRAFLQGLSQYESA